MEKSGTWTYWFKNPNGFDLSFCKNKRDIPKGYDAVISFRVEKSDGNIDHEILTVDHKVLWQKKNTNKLSQCNQHKLVYEIQKQLHKFLTVPYPEDAYKTIGNKRLKKLNIKNCKL